MVDRYQGGYDEFDGKDIHFIGRETISGTEYVVCKSCNIGIPLSEVASFTEGEERIEQLTCPPTDAEKEQHEIANGPMRFQGDY